MTRFVSSRRDFFRTSARPPLQRALFRWCAPLIAQDAKTTSKNDRPILGCIGTGDRWNAVGPQAMKFADCVAVCDVDSDHADKGEDAGAGANARRAASGRSRCMRTIASCSTARTSKS